MKRHTIIIIVTGVMVICIGCSQSVQKASEVVTLESLYASGMDKLAKNDQKGAEEDFRAIVKRDANSPEGNTGMALVEMNRSEYTRGLLAVKRVVQHNPDFVDAYIVHGRILTAQRKKSWFRAAVTAFEQALSLDPDNSGALYYYGESYLANYAFSRAEKYFDRVTQLQGALKDSAAVKLEFVRAILNVAPKSREGRRLIIDAAIDRCELCVFLIEELKIKELLEMYNINLFQNLFTLDFKIKKENLYSSDDIASHPRKQWILDIIPLQLPDLSLLPDHEFYPDRPVTRAQLAVTVRGIYQLLNVGTNDTEDRTTDETAITDVRSDYYAYDAVRFCVDRDIMQTGNSGAFRPYDTVSGLETLRTIRNLEGLFQ